MNNLRRRLLAGSLVVALPIGAPELGLAQELGSVLDALPTGGSPPAHLELAWASRDLRLQLKEAERYRAAVMKTKAGAAFYAPAMQIETYGYDSATELSRLVELAAPQGQPVPAAVAAVMTGAGPRVQLLIKVEVGFLARVDQALKSPTPPAWKAVVSGEEIVISIGEVKMAGTVDGRGWLRLSPEGQSLPADLVAPGSLFEPTMRKWALDADMLLLVMGGGMASEILSRLVEDNVLRSIVEGTRALALTWKFDGDRTSVGRLLLDAPLLKELRATARRPDLQNRLVSLWGDEATASLGIALPPRLLQVLAPMAAQELSGTPYELPPKLSAALGKLEGEVGVVGFGSPGDYAMGIELADPGTAQDCVPAFQAWLTPVMAQAGAKLQSTMALEPFPGAALPVLHLRPDVGLEGPRLAAVGSTLVAVTAKSRLAALQAQAAKPPAASAKTKADETLTPLMRQVTGGPAMLVGYLLLSDDGTLFDYFGWVAGGVYAALREKAAEVPAFALVEPYFRRLPTVMTLAGFAWALHYDVGLALDIDDSVLVLQVATSEI